MSMPPVKKSAFDVLMNRTNKTSTETTTTTPKKLSNKTNESNNNRQLDDSVIIILNEEKCEQTSTNTAVESSENYAVVEYVDENFFQHTHQYAG